MRSSLSYTWLLIGLMLASTAQAVTKQQTETITVSPASPKFTISLPSNPTTGYSWSITGYDKQRLTLDSHRYLAPKGQRIGAGGTETWVFKAQPSLFKGTQATTIEFCYARPWEPPNQGIAHAFVVKPKK